jgi:hypothetical protein
MGDMGVKGDTGDVGPQGSQGPQGVVGATGAAGVQGIQGAMGDAGAKGATGDAGLNGATGDVGPQGIQGLQGVVGATGAAGVQGIQGLKGDTGDVGPQGIAGINGTHGTNGMNGADGVSPTPVYGFIGITNPVTLGITTTAKVLTNFNISVVYGAGVSATNSKGVLVLPAGTYDVFLQFSATSGGGTDQVDAYLGINGVRSPILGVQSAFSGSGGSGSSCGVVTLNTQSQLSILISHATGTETLSVKFAQLWARKLR